MAFDYSPLYATYPSVIKKMPRRQPAQRYDFTSHEFIREWSHDNQEAYIEALYSQKKNIPFATVHGLLAQGLNQHPNLVEQAGEVDSIDIFGRSNRCMSWRHRTGVD
jgi:hypothetical protein